MQFPAFPVSPRLRGGVHGALLAAVALAALQASPAAAEQAPDQASPLIILKSIRVTGEGTAVVVEIEADGPLPMPATGRIDGPARFFLDFPGVITGTRGPREGRAPVASVRVALNSSNPPLTRVVLDLARQHEIEIDASGRAAGRIRVLVGPPAEAPADPVATRAAEPRADAPAQPPSGVGSLGPLIDPAAVPGLIPVPPLPGAGGAAEPPKPAKPATADPRLPPARPVVERPPVRTAEPSTPPEPSKDVPPPAVYAVGSGVPEEKPSGRDLDRYRKDVEAPLTRLRRLRPLLTEIDRREPKPPAGLQAARTELSAVIRVLSGVRPPEALQPAHDVLLRAASLSMMAATLRADAGTRADPTAIRNAGSAAAGALLLLDRVCIEIGCAALPAPK